MLFGYIYNPFYHSISLLFGLSYLYTLFDGYSLFGIVVNFFFWFLMILFHIRPGVGKITLAERLWSWMFIVSIFRIIYLVAVVSVLSTRKQSRLMTITIVHILYQLTILFGYVSQFNVMMREKRDGGCVEWWNVIFDE